MLLQAARACSPATQHTRRCSNPDFAVTTHSLHTLLPCSPVAQHDFRAIGLKVALAAGGGRCRPLAALQDQWQAELEEEEQGAALPPLRRTGGQAQQCWEHQRRRQRHQNRRQQQQGRQRSGRKRQRSKRGSSRRWQRRLTSRCLAAARTTRCRRQPWLCSKTSGWPGNKGGRWGGSFRMATDRRADVEELHSWRGPPHGQAQGSKQVPWAARQGRKRAVRHAQGPAWVRMRVPSCGDSRRWAPLTARPACTACLVLAVAPLVLHVQLQEVGSGTLAPLAEG